MLVTLTSISNALCLADPKCFFKVAVATSGSFNGSKFTAGTDFFKLPNRFLIDFEMTSGSQA